MIHITKRLNQSLSLKLNIPIAIFGLLILFAIAQIINHFSKENIEALVLKETRNVINSVVILAEAENSDAHLRRVVNAIAADPSIESLRLVNNTDNKIIADNRNQFFNKDITLVGNEIEKKLYQKIIDANGQPIEKIALNNLVYKAVSISLVDDSVNRLRPFTVFLVFNKENIQYDENKLLVYAVVTVAIGMLLLMFAVYWMQRKTLLVPIDKMSETLIRQQEQDDVLEIDIDSEDELGTLSYCYNTLVKSKHLKERELTEARQYVDCITDNVPLLLSYIDSNECYRFANKNHGRWCNNVDEDMIGKSMKEVFGHEIYQRLVPYIEAVKQGKSISFEMEVTFNDGIERSLYITFSPDMRDGYKDKGFFACAEDRTSLRQAEERMVEYANELEFKTWALEEAKELAETSTKTKSEFLANMSHEIRTPINGVLGMLNLLLKEHLTDRQEHYAKLAHSSGESLLTLINDILDFSKIEAGKLEIEHIEFNLYEVIGDISDAFVFRIEEKNLDFLLDIDVNVPINVVGDPSRFRQIITNFISNAIKFTDNGKITISVCVIENNDCDMLLDISVIDSGIGIPEEKQQRLFESFSQVDASTTRQYGGTGLGLAIVRQLAELMKSEVGVESEVNEGSRFWYKARLGKTICDDEKTLDTKEEETFPLHALLIDNNDANREVITRYLEHWGGTVAQCCSGEKVYQQLDDMHAEEEKIDFVLFNIDLPDLDVFRLSDTIAKDARYTKTRLVPLVTVNQMSNMEKYRGCEFFNYITKPVKPPELYRICKRLIESDKKNTLHTELSEDHENATRSGVRILLVEDNAINQEVAIGILESLGYACDVAPNGLEALEILVRKGVEGYQLILMDCQMPAMDGFETTSVIRRGRIGRIDSKIPIIAMTANAMKGDREKCLSVGMDDYITKPVDPNVLANKLASWTGKLIANQAIAAEEEHDVVSFSTGAALSSEERADKEDSETKPVKTAEIHSITEGRSKSVWNKDDLFRRVRGKRDRAHKLIAMFIKNMPERIEMFEAYVNESKEEECGSLAHEIKGIAGNLGGERLYMVSADIETAGKEHDSQAISKLFPKLCDEYQQLKHVLEIELNTAE